MRIAFFGTPEFAAVALEALLASAHDVVGVVCQPDKPAGRGQRLTAPPVKQIAVHAALPLLQPTSLRGSEILSTLRAWDPEIIVVAAYGRILPASILTLPRHGCVNIHASLLPRYRGAAPIQWVIARGDERSGVTIMQMDEGMDTGAILRQREIVLAPDETAGTLHDRLAPLGAEALLDVLGTIVSPGIVAVPQEEALATYAPMLRKQDAEIDWSRPALEIERRVRAFNPWPVAFTAVAGKRLRVWRARCGEAQHPGAPGTIVAADESIDVITGVGILHCDELQLEGRRRLPAREFIRGTGVSVGSRLG